MKLIIIGAGASFDSIYLPNSDYQEQWKPPLGKNLFSINKNFCDILNRYKGAQALQSSIMAYNDIEDYFQNQWDLIKKTYAIDLLAKLINVQFYLQELFFQISEKYSIAGLSNYDILLKKIYDYTMLTNEEVLIVTFNYDTLIEKSLEKIYGFTFNNINDYTSYPIKLFKLHGSCNWVKYLDLSKIRNLTSGINSDICNYIYNNKITLQEINKSLNSDYILINSIYPRDERKYEFDNNNVIGTNFPQILIPLKTKDDFVIPKTHIEYLKTKISNVKDILIIGWKGAEQHFHKLLKQYCNNSIIEVYSVNTDKTVEENIKPVLLNSKFTHYNGGNGTFTMFANELNNNKINIFK